MLATFASFFHSKKLKNMFSSKSLSRTLHTQETLASNPRACSRVPARLARNPALIPVEAQDRVRCACGGGDDTVLVDSHTTMLVWIRFESLLGIHI